MLPKNAFRALAQQKHLLLIYTKLRHKLQIDFAKACLRNARSGFALAEEQRAILSLFCSEAEYHISSRHWPGMEGAFVTEPF